MCAHVEHLYYTLLHAVLIGIQTKDIDEDHNADGHTIELMGDGAALCENYLSVYKDDTLTHRHIPIATWYAIEAHP